MALIYISGLESGTIENEGLTNNGASIVTSPVRTGAYSLNVNKTSGNAIEADRFISPTLSDIYVRFYFRYSAVTTAGLICNVAQSGSAGDARLQLNTNGTITVLDSAGAEVGTSSAE